jgi:phosphatidylserine decarboxylase
MFTQFIHPEGWRFAAIFGGIALLLFFLSPILGWLGVILTVWCFYFFRNPTRVIPDRYGLIVSPADGKIVAVQEIVPPADWGMGSEVRVRISIFLNVFDVHLNRIPIKSQVRKVLYHTGKFLNASLDKASEHNERNTLILDINNEQDMAVTQIAGLIARRIRCDVQPDQAVRTGELFGLIRFGSRTDIYLPVGVSPLVIEGQRMIGGETVLADLTSDETARQGIIL